MKIDEKKSRKSAAAGFSVGGERKAAPAQGASFQNVLGQTSQKIETDRLWLAVEEQAERLKRRLDLVELRKYQEQVRRFLARVLGDAYKLQERIVRDQRGRQKVMTVIGLVDDKMGELADMIVKEEKDRLGILAKIDEIRGLMIDMVM